MIQKKGRKRANLHSPFLTPHSALRTLNGPYSPPKSVTNRTPSA